jgi:hypothetical protein
MLPALLTLALGAVQIDIAPGAQCVAPESLTARLQKLDVPLARPAELEVTITQDGDQVRVAGLVRATGATFLRAVPATAEDCDAVERVIAALVRAWNEATPAQPPEPAPAPTPAPIPRRVPRPAPPPAQPEPPPAPEPPVRMLPEIPEMNIPHPGGPPRARPFTGGSGPVDLPGDLERKVQETRPNTNASAAPPGLVARLAIRAGVAGGPAPTATPLGSASFHVGNPWFGAELEGGFAGAVQQSFGDGTVRASMQWLTLSARVDVPVFARMRFEGLVGLRGTRIGVTAEGYDVVHNTELYALGAYAAAGLDIRLIGPLSLVFRGVFTLRFPEDHLVIDGVGEALTLRVWQVGAEGGLGIWFP